MEFSISSLSRTHAQVSWNNANPCMISYIIFFACADAVPESPEVPEPPEEDPKEDSKEDSKEESKHDSKDVSQEYGVPRIVNRLTHTDTRFYTSTDILIRTTISRSS